MKSVGEILKKNREKHHLSLQEISKKTFISSQDLDAIERNAFGELRSAASVFGFVQLYAQFLEIDEKTILALLRRDYHSPKEHPSSQTLRQYEKKIAPRYYSRLRVGLLLGSIIVVIAGYALWSMYKLTQPPKLMVSTPTDGAEVKRLFIVRGITDSDAIVEVDTQPVALTQDGEFAREMELSTGEHIITVIAKNRHGSEAIRQLSVNVEE